MLGITSPTSYLTPGEWTEINLCEWLMEPTASPMQDTLLEAQQQLRNCVSSEKTVCSDLAAGRTGTPWSPLSNLDSDCRLWMSSPAKRDTTQAMTLTQAVATGICLVDLPAESLSPTCYWWFLHQAVCFYGRPGLFKLSQELGPELWTKLVTIATKTGLCVPNLFGHCCTASALQIATSCTCGLLLSSRSSTEADLTTGTCATYSVARHVCRISLLHICEHDTIP